MLGFGGCLTFLKFKPIVTRNPHVFLYAYNFSSHSTKARKFAEEEEDKFFLIYPILKGCERIRKTLRRQNYDGPT